MCQAQMRWLRRLDWFQALELTPISSVDPATLPPGVTPESLREAMHVISANGQCRTGARGVRHLALRVPLLAPWALLMWIPGMIHVADWVYRRVASNRYVLSRFFGCSDSCQILSHAERNSAAKA